jgi:hypothetical protein
MFAMVLLLILLLVDGGTAPETLVWPGVPEPFKPLLLLVSDSQEKS